MMVGTYGYKNTDELVEIDCYGSFPWKMGVHIVKLHT